MTGRDRAIRRVGVEIEFAGLNAEQAARVLESELGGVVHPVDPHSFVLVGSEIGDVAVELDSRYAHADSARELLGPVGAALAPIVGAAAGLLVPCEAVMLVPLDRLHETERVIAVLRRAGGKGTGDSTLYAFGLHLNPEIPDEEPQTIASVLKAFVLLNAWLRREAVPDSTRAFLGFADPFPEGYARRLVDPAYWPDMAALIEDYLLHNPTRNRDLDALPLFAHLAPDRVRAVLPTEKIRPRPAFHYRLPNARVSDPGWSVAPDWNRWVVVETLAADRERLDRLGNAYLALAGETQSWADVAERIALG